MGKAVSDQLPEGFELEASELPPGFEIQEPAKAKTPRIDPRGAVGETLMHLGSAAMAAPIAGLTALGAPLSKLTGIGDTYRRSLGLTPESSAADVGEAVQNAMTYEPHTPGGQAMTRTATYPFRKIGEFADYVGNAAATDPAPATHLSGVTANLGLDPMVSNQRSPGERAATGSLVNTGVQALPALLLKGRAKAGGVAEDVTGTNPLGRSVAGSEGAQAPAAASQAGRTAGLDRVPAPTRSQLSDAADAAYKRADESGVIVTPDSFGALKAKITEQMRADGIDPTLHPDATAALRRITQSEGPQSLKQLETLRRIANDAEGSIKPADQRLAGKMVDELDEYIDSLTEKDVVAGDASKGKALAEARNFYSRKKKAEELDRLVSRAELSAPNFSASGMENALRTEFRTLAKNDRRMRRFTAEEQEAIRKVAKGGPTENALRMLGKLAPTGVVSSLPTILATMATGPIGAAPALAGLAGRYAATRMTLGNVTKANELVRRGPPGSPAIPPATLEEAVRNGVLTPEQAQFLNH